VNGERLKLDPTGQYLGGPPMAPHTNERPDAALVARCVAALELVSGH
jgi:hypothetical protein